MLLTKAAVIHFGARGQFPRAFLNVGGLTNDHGLNWFPGPSRL
jgi:hypothetical protein